MNLLKTFLILFLAFTLLSCGNSEDDVSKFKNEREASDKSIPRQTNNENDEQAPKSDSPKSQKVEPKPDKTFLPLKLNTDGIKTLVFASKDGQKITVSTEPKAKPLGVLSSLKSVASVTSSANKYTVLLSPTKDKQKIYFEFDKKATNLKIKDKQTVEQNQIIAETKKAFVFYVKADNKLTAICLSENLEKVKLVQDFKTHPDCK